MAQLLTPEQIAASEALYELGFQWETATPTEREQAVVTAEGMWQTLRWITSPFDDAALAAQLQFPLFLHARHILETDGAVTGAFPDEVGRLLGPYLQSARRAGRLVRPGQSRSTGTQGGTGTTPGGLVVPGYSKAEVDALLAKHDTADDAHEDIRQEIAAGARAQAGATEAQARAIKANEDRLVDMRYQTDEVWQWAQGNDSGGFLGLLPDAANVARVKSGQVPLGGSWVDSGRWTDARIIIVRLPRDRQHSDYRLVITGFTPQPLIERLTAIPLRVTGTTWRYYSTLAAVPENVNVRLEHHGPNSHTKYEGDLDTARVIEAASAATGDDRLPADKIKGLQEAVTPTDLSSYLQDDDVAPYTQVFIDPQGIPGVDIPDSITVYLYGKRTSRTLTRVQMILAGSTLPAVTTGLNVDNAEVKITVPEGNQNFIEPGLTSQDTAKFSVLNLTFSDGSTARYGFPFYINNASYAPPSEPDVFTQSQFNLAATASPHISLPWHDLEWDAYPPTDRKPAAVTGVVGLTFGKAGTPRLNIRDAGWYYLGIHIVVSWPPVARPSDEPGQLFLSVSGSTLRGEFSGASVRLDNGGAWGYLSLDSGPFYVPDGEILRLRVLSSSNPSNMIFRIHNGEVELTRLG